MRNCSRSTLLALSPLGTLSRTCVDGSGFLRNSRGRPRVRARGHSSVFPNFADLRDAPAAIPRGANPWNVFTGERTRKETGPRFTPQWEPRQAPCVGRDPPGGNCCGPTPTSTNCELLVSNEISTRVHMDQL